MRPSGTFAAPKDVTNLPIDNSFGENIPPVNSASEPKKPSEPDNTESTERRERQLFIWEQRALAKTLIRIKDILPNWAEYIPLESDCETSISFTNFQFHWAKVAFSRDRGDLTPYLELFTAFYKPRTSVNRKVSDGNSDPTEPHDLNTSTTDDPQPAEDSPFIPKICISPIEVEHICSTLDLYRSVTSAVTHRSDYLMRLTLSTHSSELNPTQTTPPPSPPEQLPQSKLFSPIPRFPHDNPFPTFPFPPHLPPIGHLPPHQHNAMMFANAALLSQFPKPNFPPMPLIPPPKQPPSSSNAEATTMSAKEAARLIAEMAKSGQGPDLPQKIWDAVGPREDPKVKDDPNLTPQGRSSQHKRPRLKDDGEFGEEEDRPQSGVPGVHWSTRPRGWAVTWTENGKRKVKYFPAATYGEDRGRELAVEHKMNILRKPHS